MVIGLIFYFCLPFIKIPKVKLIAAAIAFKIVLIANDTSLNKYFEMMLIKNTARGSK
ncbi:hypothetical protein [Lysinibacillus telephonicus]|uniref:hypothetical protein n=1 Tax=Lysinibacillus telephonicus TaxID=1714840 RepID=UPI003BA371C6